jgi:ubiquitin carboxyl-terminal hydrolase 5/13
MEVELNATYAFDAITEAGSHLVPVSGPGLQGLQNLGNSCYMNSVVQLLLSGTVPELAKRYGTDKDVTNNSLLTSVSPKEAPSDLLCQTTKLACALTSGTFAGPVPESTTVTDAKLLDPKYRLQPRMFKHVIAGDHVDFKTGQQQDTAHFLQFMLEKLDRAEISAAASQRLVTHDAPLHVASHLFSFRTTSRLVCTADNRIKYKESAPETMWCLPVPMDKAAVLDDEPELKRQKSEEEKTEKPAPTVTFQACVDSWGVDTTLDDYRWPHLQKQVHPATQRMRLTNFPRYLLVQIQRYTLGADWTPQKLEVTLDIPEEVDLMALKATGPQEEEDLVREEEEESDTTRAHLNAPFAIDEGAMGQLMDMGFSFNGCRRALTAVGGSDVEAAMNWVFEHSTDPDFNDPMPEVAAVSTTTYDDSGVDESVVMSLVENLGCFTMDQVRAALKETSGAADRAADWLFSHMVCSPDFEEIILLSIFLTILYFVDLYIGRSG